MLKKPSVCIGGIVLGIVLIGVSFLLQGEELKAWSGICIGVGASLSGISLPSLFMIRYDNKHPQQKRLKEIELKDERNRSITNRAKARSADIVQWLIMAIAYLLILIDAPLWATLAVVLVFTTYHILNMWFTIRYQKEM
ncbi:MAG: hypothetical protein K0R57_6154 [Paenibacillaceae bacterium]|nr:hypothetical protein [Paenibacillaceae bacterium]